MNVLFKRGGKGSTYYKYDDSKENELEKLQKLNQGAFNFDDFKHKTSFKLVDTTGAGDAFTAGFCVGIVEELNNQEAMYLGTQTAFLTISKYGAGPSMPTRKDI